MLVVELDGASAGLGDGEVAGLGLDVLDLVPSLLGHVLGDQGVFGLDVGEFSGHFDGCVGVDVAGVIAFRFTETMIGNALSAYL